MKSTLSFLRFLSTSATVQVSGTNDWSFYKLAGDKRPTLVRSANSKKALILNPPATLGLEWEDGANCFTWRMVPTVTSKDKGLVPDTRITVPASLPFLDRVVMTAF